MNKFILIITLISALLILIIPIYDLYRYKNVIRSKKSKIYLCSSFIFIEGSMLFHMNLNKFDSLFVVICSISLATIGWLFANSGMNCRRFACSTATGTTTRARADGQAETRSEKKAG
jgi:hypothetical protein